MGLGSVTENGVVFLSIAGGYIWNRKATEEDPNFAEQKFERKDGTEGVRKGARYADLTGRVVKVEFKTHAEYGENINVTIDSGEERYVVAIGTNNRNSQDFMKALMVADLSKDLFIKPYDFVGKDGKRAQGISFRQNGEKLDLKIENAPTKEAEWFKSADKKKIKRFFEDLTDWFIGEIQETIIPKLAPLEAKEPKTVEKKQAPKTETKKEEESQDQGEEDDERDFSENNTSKETEEKPAAKKEEEVKTATPLAMKKAIKEYIAENYPDQEYPALEKEDVVKWYNLVLKEEELPFEEKDESEVDQDDLNAALDALLPRK